MGMVRYRDLMQKVHVVNPYTGFDARDIPLDLQGWNGEAALFGELIARVRPELIVEVGTWKGQSAITMARHLQRFGCRGKILCIDTWLGTYDFWSAPAINDLHGMLGLKHGYPTVYYQFLANVLHTGTEEIIVPYPSTSTNAARFLILHGLQPDLIYIDASHEENDVYLDIAYYWLTLRAGGVMFGDDFSPQVFPGLVDSVEAFSREQCVDLEIVDGQYWIMHKPAEQDGDEQCRETQAAGTGVAATTCAHFASGASEP